MNASTVLNFAKIYAERSQVYDIPMMVSSYLLDDEHPIFDKFRIHFGVHAESKEQVFLILDSINCDKPVTTLRSFIDILDYGIKIYGDHEIYLGSNSFGEGTPISDLDSGGFYSCYYRNEDCPDVTIQTVLLADVRHDDLANFFANRREFKIIM